jgi:hypothetical protein
MVDVSSEVLAVVTVTSSVIWDIMPCSLKMETKFSSETSADFHRTTQRYVVENRTLY